MDRLEALLAFLEEDPDDAFTLFALAGEYRKQGDLQQALGYYRRLLDDHPDYVGTYYHFGKALEEAGDTEKALGMYRQGIEVATRLNDFHARSELQDALLKAEGLGWDDD
jgi:tetratricopeptide (TPR) repeat protein